MTEQEKFEAWYKSCAGFGRDAQKSPSDWSSDYIDSRTQDYWVGWQASIASREPRWRPIETAPKTGEWIIVFDGIETRPDYWLDSDIKTWAKSPSNKKPKLWMPLPPPPKE